MIRQGHMERQRAGGAYVTRASGGPGYSRYMVVIGCEEKSTLELRSQSLLNFVNAPKWRQGGKRGEKGAGNGAQSDTTPLTTTFDNKTKCTDSMIPVPSLAVCNSSMYHNKNNLYVHVQKGGHQTRIISD